MISVADALQLVLQHCRPLPAVPVSPVTAALGLVLAEDVASDLDMPPFDKAMMDGYAVRRGEVSEGVALPVAAEVMAGQVPPPLPAGQAIRIMTGAPIPAGVRSEERRVGKEC